MFFSQSSSRQESYGAVVCDGIRLATALCRHLMRLPPLLIVLVWGVMGALNVATAPTTPVEPTKVAEIAFISACGMLLSLSLHGMTCRLVAAGSRRALLPLVPLTILAALTLWVINWALKAWITAALSVDSMYFWSGRDSHQLKTYWLYYLTVIFALQVLIFVRVEIREKQLVTARLEALRFQLNPHFLFNTLNAIATLISEGSNADAENMVTRLSDFLRESFAVELSGLVSLARELDTVQAYLEIESVRFRDRLQVHFACDSGLADVLVPSLILQPLVENAVKYGVAPSKHQVTVSVEASTADNDLILVVEDDGAHKPFLAGAPGTGVGLRNVAARLEALYGSSSRIEAIPRERGFMAVIRLPLRRGTV